jgi:hypothetical protein
MQRLFMRIAFEKRKEADGQLHAQPHLTLACRRTTALRPPYMQYRAMLTISVTIISARANSQAHALSI